jgi:hypothetical protein
VRLRPVCFASYRAASADEQIGGTHFNAHTAEINNSIAASDILLRPPWFAALPILQQTPAGSSHFDRYTALRGG